MAPPDPIPLYPPCQRTAGAPNGVGHMILTMHLSWVKHFAYHHSPALSTVQGVGKGWVKITVTVAWLPWSWSNSLRVYPGKQQRIH